MDWDEIFKIIGGLVTGGALVAFYNLFRAGSQNNADNATAAEKISTVSLDWVHEFSGQLKDAVGRIDALEAENQAKDTRIAAQDAKIEALETDNKKKDLRITEQDKKIDMLEKENERLSFMITQRDEKIAESERKMADMQQEINRLQSRRKKARGMLDD
jgi:chromosome segregation ATPase